MARVTAARPHGNFTPRAEVITDNDGERRRRRRLPHVPALFAGSRVR